MKEIFLQFLTLNPALNPDDICAITGRERDIVDGWFHNGDSPDLFSILLMKDAAVKAGMVVHRDMFRLINELFSHAKCWARANSTGQEYTLLGDKKGPSGRESFTYVYEGKPITLKELSRSTGIEQSTIIKACKRNNAQSGIDITTIVRNIKPRM